MQAWGKSEFGIEDISATKPSYSKSPQIKETTTPPQMTPVEKVKEKEFIICISKKGRKPRQIYRTIY